MNPSHFPVHELMSDEKVCAILNSLSLQDLIPRFRENAIDDELLGDLTDDDLAELGLKLGHRKKFFKLVSHETPDSSNTSISDEQDAAVSSDLSSWERLPGERKNISILVADWIEPPRMKNTGEKPKSLSATRKDSGWTTR